MAAGGLLPKITLVRLLITFLNYLFIYLFTKKIIITNTRSFNYSKLFSTFTAG